MADKRMFNKSIVLSDAFLDMPATTRCLYFTLSMLADDDGFVNSPKSIMRQCGSSDDDFKILMAKKFIIPFESGIVVIKHWRINNYLRADRYKPTKYTDERAELEIEENGSYTLKKDAPKAVTKKIPLTEREPKNDIEKVEKLYLKNYGSLYKSGVLKMEKPIINWGVSRKLTKDCIEKYGVEKIEEAIRNSINNKFVVSNGYSLTTILSVGVLSQLLNKTDSRIDNDTINCKELGF